MGHRAGGYWAIDAGGTRTTALVLDTIRHTRGSVNPASAGAAAEETLVRLLAEIAADLSGTAVGWFASSAITMDTAPAAIDRLAVLAREQGLPGRLVVSGDVPPLLLAPPLSGRGVVVVAGTGSACVASAGPDAGPPVVIGGCEYLGSDQGSAYALGEAGLRAAVRGADGRGRPTTLFAAAEPRELARRLAAEPFPKAAVAALAPEVCAAWQAGDAVAGEVVRAGVDELITGVRAARDAAGLTGTWRAVLNGGVFRGCPPYAAELSRRIVTELGAAEPPTVVVDPVAAIYAALLANDGSPPKSWAHIRNL
ncbi:BadF/BadG/BcrA/BcrD ATPase family protein [Embleya sp. NPDC020886]|uniref:BadF/BadG/BcrA/BcrD ATPase family protein n=1 Tax=Embleya sp. NPDC020886 TaxID=3363980 RepID=UPI0037A460D0